MMRSLFVSWTLGLMVLLGACSAAHRPPGDSNTNWLEACSDKSECGAAQACVCGVCTRACTTASGCTLGKDVRGSCVDPTATGIESACALKESAGSICLAGCTKDSACPGGESCVQGACIAARALQLLSALGGACIASGGCVTGLQCSTERTCVEVSDAGVSSDAATDGSTSADAGDAAPLADPCAANNGGCDALAKCSAANGTRLCTACPQGYDDVHGDGTLCTDIDECATGRDDCAKSALCTNTAGSFVCACTGLEVGDGKTCASPLPIVSAGQDATCVVRSDGTLWCWGSNTYGQLGRAATLLDATPKQVGSDTGWTDVSVGTGFACGVRSGGLYCWGQCDTGQCAQQDGLSSAVPRRVGTSADWLLVSAGQRHACGIRAGQAYCWGDNSLLQLGLGTNSMVTVQTTPVRVGSEADWQSLAAGGNHTCAIRAGQLYCWGTFANYSVFDPKAEPTRIGSETGWFVVSSGQEHSCAILRGQLYCWGGDNWYGDLGTANTPPTAVQHVGSAGDWVGISAGGFTSCGIRASGAVFCWGNNATAQLGPSLNGSTYEPFEITAAAGSTRISVGSTHVCVVSAGTVSCWGSNFYGAVSGDKLGVVMAPRRVGTANQWQVIATAADGSFSPSNPDVSSCGIEAGSLYCWGTNRLGQLGTGIASSQEFPTQITSLTPWTAISAGPTHTCAVLAGALYCWGYNGSGELGIGSQVDHPTPSVVGSDQDWTQVAAGKDHSCGLRAGELYCWGSATSGQTGFSTDRSTPGRVGTDADWTSIVAVGSRSCGLRSGGNLYCWGTGYYSAAPSPVAPSGSWSAIAVSVHTCGVRAGALYCWGGDNAYGQLGNGSMSSGTSPMQVGLDTDWQTTAVGTAHSCGIRAGKLFCWGHNQVGQLGVGEGVDSTLAVQVDTNTDWQLLAAAGDQTCGVRAGQLYCWGDAQASQLGLGYWKYQTPVTVTLH